MSEKQTREYIGQLWADADGITYLNTHDAGPSLRIGDNAQELADLTLGLEGKRVRIVIETIDDE